MGRERERDGGGGGETEGKKDKGGKTQRLEGGDRGREAEGEGRKQR